jgi:hypothetical protein
MHPDQMTAERLAGLRAGAACPGATWTRGSATAASPRTRRSSTPLVLGDRSFGDVTNIVCGYAENPAPLWWLLAFCTRAVAGIGTMLILYMIDDGRRHLGPEQPGRLGVGHHELRVLDRHRPRGTLISAILCLLKQKWRTAVNRSAEAMTIFAVICAGIFPGIHVGRVWFAWFLFPIPNYNYIWPNFRSPLLWDVFAVSTYATVSALFWYMGMIPDLATLRDRADARLRAGVSKPFSIALPGGTSIVIECAQARRDPGVRSTGWRASGWRFSSRHWHRYEAAYLILAGISTPLVLSVHSIVSFDFATSILPGWHTTIFPPYFVAGAIFGGFAMVLLLLIPLREVLPNFKDLLTLRHLENMAKIILLTGMMVGFAYAMEFFIAWYGGNEYEWYVFIEQPREPGAGPLLVGLLGDDFVQRDQPAGVLVPQAAAEPAGDLDRRVVRDHRHVVRAVRDHRDQPAPGVPARRVAHVLPDADRHRHLRRLDRDLRDAVPAVREVPAGVRDGGAQGRHARGRPARAPRSYDPATRRAPRRVRGHVREEHEGRGTEMSILRHRGRLHPRSCPSPPPVRHRERVAGCTA